MPRRHTHFLASHVDGITRFWPVFVGEVQGSDSAKPASRLNQYALFALEWNDGVEAEALSPVL